MICIMLFTIYRIVRFLEKPSSHQTSSNCASVVSHCWYVLSVVTMSGQVFYCLRKEILSMVSSYTRNNTTRQSRVLGLFMVIILPINYIHTVCTSVLFFQSWLVTQTPVYAMKLPTPFQLIGQIVSHCITK